MEPHECDPVPVTDALLAAISKVNGLTFVTRNSTAVEGLDVDFLDPFEVESPELM